MNLLKDTQAFSDHGYVVNGQFVYGAEGDVPFLMTLTKKGAMIQFALDVGMDGAERSAVKAAIKRLGYKGTAAANLVSITVKADPQRPAESIVDALPGIVAVLKQNNVPYAQVCPFCGARDTDAFMLCPAKNGMQAGYRAVHQGCVSAAHAEVRDKAARNEGNYITGIIGAILGMIVGVLPTVFTIWQFQTIYALICALIPICAFYGYKLFKGKMNKFAIGITIVLSLVGAFVIEAALDILDSILNYGATFAESVTYMFTYLPIDAAYREYFFSGIWQLLLFAALGVFICSSIFRRTNVGEAKMFGSMLGTLRLKDGAKPAVQAENPYGETLSEQPR